jgi:hypothetical protein
MPIVRRRAGALAPAGVGLTLLIVTVQIRMDDSWADGVLLLVAALPAALLLFGGLTAAREDPIDRAATTALLVGGCCSPASRSPASDRRCRATTSATPAARSPGCSPCSRG